MTLDDDELDEKKYVEIWRDHHSGSTWQVMEGPRVIVMRSKIPWPEEKGEGPEKDMIIMVRMNKGIPQYAQGIFDFIDGKMEGLDLCNIGQVEVSTVNYITRRYRLKMSLPNVVYKTIYRPFSTFV
jgi:hypothetical protein